MEQEKNVSAYTNEDEENSAKKQRAEYNTNKRKLKKEEKKIRRFQTFMLHALLFVFVVWLLFFKFIGLIQMPSNDMYPRIDAGDLLLYDRLDKNQKAQDVVLFIKNDTEYVGRIIAVGGDTVEITDGNALIVNGNYVSEPGIFEETTRYEGFVKFPLTVPAGEFFILSDHRQGGEDSRYFGTVKQSEIKGTIINVLRRNNL